jgi:hypothetical protein
MVSEEQERKILERGDIDAENQRRAKQGRALKPIPEELMNDEELEIASNEQRIKERNKARGKLINPDSREEDIIYDSKGREVYDKEGLSIDYSREDEK